VVYDRVPVEPDGILPFFKTKFFARLVLMACIAYPLQVVTFIRAALAYSKDMVNLY
jgi:hypothetical protein